jgi:glycosyltransferase involved in cell wall biosynthesis
LRVLLVHNHYQQPGGEDRVFAAEGRLLETQGHRVSRYTVHNDQVKDLAPLALAKATVWNKTTWQELHTLIQGIRPEIVHLHNTFPLISPAAYYACQAANVPVVQTLHNYRLICPNALFLREGRVCEDCMGKTPPWPGILHACYRSSRAQTAVTVGMLTYHRWRKTWQEHVQVYLALTEFSRQKFIEGGLPPDRIVVKPNFVDPDPGEQEDDEAGMYALFVGRLSVEKGVDTLLKAWQRVGEIPLKIIGDGPLLDRAAGIARQENRSSIEFLGRLDHSEALACTKRARFLILPSVCYENLPTAILEAFACGVPAVVSRTGAMAEIVSDGRTGLHFEAGDPEDLAAKVEWAWTHPLVTMEMGKEARLEYESKYTAEQNYHQLMAIYQAAVGQTQTG